MKKDLGFTHIALPVAKLEPTIAFYAKYARMSVIHQRQDVKTGWRVAWLSDRTRPFVIVLLEGPGLKIGATSDMHLGVGCESREEVDRLSALAKKEGILWEEPRDAGYPVGYYSMLRDPDGYSLEISFGQEVAFQIESPKKPLSF